MTDTTRSSSTKGVQIVRGLPFPDLPWFLKEKIEDALDYVPQDGDTMICSYPKTGTTWLQYIVHQVVSKGDTPPTMQDMGNKMIPFLEMAGVETIVSLEEPRFYKHHFPCNFSKHNPKTKCLYIYRNPEDTVVSYYHFMVNLMGEDIDFDKFFEGFMTGDIGYGGYFEHVLSYLSYEKESQNILLISYEKLKRNTRNEILRIAKFIGEGYYQDIAEDESTLKRILEHTSFDYMKNKLSLVKPRNGQDKNSNDDPPMKINFFRKGSIGDGRSILSTDQLERIRQLMTELMKGTCILEEWLDQK